MLDNAFWDLSAALRITAPREEVSQNIDGSRTGFVKKHFPMNFITAPLIADLFLLAILAIGREEVHDGTVGADHIYPIDVMVFFISLAYIAISLDAAGLIRWLAFKVLQKAGKHGRRLYFYLYLFFFILASLIGNDPVILSGTPFLAYMTRVSENIENPKAWIYTQFCLANIGSAVLVTSNPTNLVLAGAFKIKFIVYTANIIVPVVATTILLFPFLLYVVFNKQSLVPRSIKLHELPGESRDKQPINPNMPYANSSSEDDEQESEEGRLRSLEEVMNPYLDKWSAIFGASIMGVTLITILAINAAIQDGESVPAFYITLPAAVVTFCWDVISGWKKRHETRKICLDRKDAIKRPEAHELVHTSEHNNVLRTQRTSGAWQESDDDQKPEASVPPSPPQQQLTPYGKANTRPTLVSYCLGKWAWCRETFPNATTVLQNLPYPLVPFALCMFVLVQALVSRGWIAVFAYGWSHWVRSTGTVGAIGGMAFLSVLLCNFAGTNIGTAILLCRVVQAWVQIHRMNHDPISQRTFWATIYSLTIGLNFGAFSTCFSASLAGLLWRDILKRKKIIVKELDFAKVNLSIIAFTMVVACTVLVGEVYITRKEAPYHGSG